MLSSLVLIFEGKRDSINPNSYRGIKLLEHAFKLYKKVLDGSLHEILIKCSRVYARKRGC